jgi:hypothetical protein
MAAFTRSRPVRTIALVSGDVGDGGGDRTGKVRMYEPNKSHATASIALHGVTGDAIGTGLPAVLAQTRLDGEDHCS